LSARVVLHLVYPVLLVSLDGPFLSDSLKQGPSRETSNTGNTR
jgi:hypothetical protein